MTIEDDDMHENRRILLRRQNEELRLMSLEEEVRANWEQADFNAREDRELAQAQDHAIQASYRMLSSMKFRKRTNVVVDAQVTTYHLPSLDYVINSTHQLTLSIQFILTVQEVAGPRE